MDLSAVRDRGAVARATTESFVSCWHHDPVWGWGACVKSLDAAEDLDHATSALSNNYAFREISCYASFSTFADKLR